MMDLHEVCLLPAGTRLWIKWYPETDYTERILGFNYQGRPQVCVHGLQGVAGRWEHLFYFDHSPKYQDIRLEPPSS